MEALAKNTVCCRLIVVVNTGNWFIRKLRIVPALFPAVTFNMSLLSCPRERSKLSKISVETTLAFSRVFVRMNGMTPIKFAR